MRGKLLSEVYSLAHTHAPTCRGLAHTPTHTSKQADTSINQLLTIIKIPFLGGPFAAPFPFPNNKYSAQTAWAREDVKDERVV